MGADGGTIISRSDILSTKDNKQIDIHQPEDKEEVLIKTCHYSSIPLYKNDPIVGDYKGKLYIKEQILKYILGTKQDKSTIILQLSHISSLKDICPVKLSWTLVDQVPFIQCPVTKEIEKSYVYLRTCGCLVSNKALKEFRKDGKCPNCDTVFEDCDVVILDPLNRKENVSKNDETINILKANGLSHSKLPLKKSKKRKPEDEFVKKRKLLQDDPNDSKKVKT
ncbi:RTF2 Replication termination factor 2 [Candida maltosa Xu316]|uniref:Replication termination factor 2 n=1 Tax=Candida maltosa (strain Xu316) TaxID=1245528 RepID=M3IN78_CANMX|nr:hypothetical protein G210_1688 [Candida maltosa Xu316]